MKIKWRTKVPPKLNAWETLDQAARRLAQKERIARIMDREYEDLQKRYKLL